MTERIPPRRARRILSPGPVRRQQRGAGTRITRTETTVHQQPDLPPSAPAAITSFHTENTEVARIIAAHNTAMRFAADRYPAKFNEAYHAIRKAEAEAEANR
jgi:hypothetical protein